MKKTIKYLVFSLLMLFGFSLNVNAETLPAAVDGKITLDKDYTIDSVTFDSSSDVSVLDLNGKTLTINDNLKIAKAFEIKNGTIKRSSVHISQSIIEITSGTSGIVNVKSVVLDGIKGKKDVTTYYTYAGPGIYINNNSSAVLDDVTFKDHYVGNELGAGALNIQNANSVIVKNSKFFGNVSIQGRHECGAAINVIGAKRLELINTQIYENFSYHVASVDVQNVEEFIMDKDTVIRDNEADCGGAMRIKDSNATISGTFENNIANLDNGGALYTMFDTDAPNMVIRITKDAKFINNETVAAGGGLYVNSNKPNMPGKVIIEGATFSGNKALGTVDASDGLFKDIGGGAIAVARGILEINDINMSGNTAAINKGNSIIVSHANGNLNGGKLTINGGTFDDSIDLGVGTIVVNGGIFKDDMSKYITNKKLISKKTDNGYEVVENKVLENDDVIFENDDAMDSNYELVITEKSDLLKDEKVTDNIKTVIVNKDNKAKDIKVLAMYDISVNDGINEIEMKDGKFKITISVDEKLLKYDAYSVVYVDDDGKVTCIPASVDGNKVSFETSHLSTYGVVGYNNITNPETNINLDFIISIILFGLMFACIGVSLKKQNINA